MKKRLISGPVYGLAILCIGFCGCYRKNEVPIANIKVYAHDTVNTANVTYNNYMYGLLKNNCGTCHASNGSAAAFWINEFTYISAKYHAKSIVETMLNNTMPPPPKFSFLERDKQLMKAWLENGCPE